MAGVSAQYLAQFVSSVEFGLVFTSVGELSIHTSVPLSLGLKTGAAADLTHIKWSRFLFCSP